MNGKLEANLIDHFHFLSRRECGMNRVSKMLFTYKNSTVISLTAGMANRLPHYLPDLNLDRRRKLFTHLVSWIHGNTMLQFRCNDSTLKSTHRVSGGLETENISLRRKIFDLTLSSVPGLGTTWMYEVSTIMLCWRINSSCSDRSQLLQLTGQIEILF